MRFNIQPYKNQNSSLKAAQFSPRGPALSFGDKRIDNIFNGGLNSHAMHEIYGPAAVALTSMIASFTTGKIIWIRSKNQHKQLNPHGIVYINNNLNNYINIFSKPKYILWAVEQAARSSASSVVIAELPQSPDFVSSRRLQLIAREQGTLVIVLPYHDRNIPPSAAETRFRATSIPRSISEAPRFQIDLFKNKNGTNFSWKMEWHDPKDRFSMVSQYSNRSNCASLSHMAR
jgi:protein ImuA